MDKILTISIAAYNVEKYIGNTLQSCLSENTAKDIEILVIDDGGKDGTVEIAESWQRQYPTSISIIRKENGGYGSTINEGIKRAKGKYFKQLDGDDWFDNEGLESHIYDLKAHDVDMALTPNVKFFENNGKQELRDHAANMETGEYYAENVNLSGDINMHSVTYRTQMLRDINLKITEHCFYTDTELVLFPLQYVEKIFISHIPVYYYRVGLEDQSMSDIGIRKHIGDHLTVLEHIFNLYNNIINKDNKTASWIYYRLKTEVINHYKYMCVLKISKKNFKLLKTFDKTIKKDNSLYQEIVDRSRLVRVLKNSGFLFYPLCCLWMKRKFHK